MYRIKQLQRLLKITQLNSFLFNMKDKINTKQLVPTSWAVAVIHSTHRSTYRERMFVQVLTLTASFIYLGVYFATQHFTFTRLLTSIIYLGIGNMLV